MSKKPSLENAVKEAVAIYFKNLDGEAPTRIYDMVIDSVEKTLLQDILDRADGNQSAAANMLGINRNTLRAKMKKYRVLT